MNETPSAPRTVLREIAWRDLFPWLMLTRVFRPAIHPAILAIALAASLAVSLSWKLAASVFRITPKNTPELADKAERLGRLPGSARNLESMRGGSWADPKAAFSRRSPIHYAYEKISAGAHGIAHGGGGWRGFAFFATGLLASIAIWGWAGGVITRFAVVQVGSEETPGLRRACRAASARWIDYFTAPLYPVVGIVTIALLTMPLGWMLRSDAGTISAGVLWILALLGGLVSALLAIWLAIGWPLMAPAISAEETGDAFEGMSRSFAYAFQRPLHYLFYVFLVSYLGLIAWDVVHFFANTAIEATHWSAAWGAGTERMEKVSSAGFGGAASKELGTALRYGAGMITGVEGLLRALAEAFAFSFFWSAAAGVYLLLRYDVDRMEPDQVWLDDDVPRYPLPPLEKDAAGVPGTAEAESKPSNETAPQAEATANQPVEASAPNPPSPPAPETPPQS